MHHFSSTFATVTTDFYILRFFYEPGFTACLAAWKITVWDNYSFLYGSCKFFGNSPGGFKTFTWTPFTEDIT